MKPGEIYLADLYEAGVWPVLIVSRESLNRGGYAVAVPFTTAHFERRRRLPNCVAFQSGQSGLTKDCVAQCEAILTVDQSQFENGAGPIGAVDDAIMRDVIRAIGHVIESNCEPD